MDMSAYRGLFISETREHLRAMNEAVMALEKTPQDRECIDALFRAAHSIKGMAASMGYEDVTELAHRAEDLMDRVRKDTLGFDGSVADLLLEAADLLGALVDDLEGEPLGGLNVKDLVERLSTYVAPSLASGTEPAVAVKPGGVAEGLSSPTGRSPAGGEAQRTVRVRTELLDRLVNVTGELITTKSRLGLVSGENASPPLAEALADLGRLVHELRNEVMTIRLMPFGLICERLPRLVRDLAKKSGKEVTFVIEGEGIELDRGILEELPDLLIHILRNAVDHGIETPEERLAVGKKAKGTIRLVAQRDRDQVLVEIEDDGGGMDAFALISSAVAKGLISYEEGSRMTPVEAYMLTCLPGFSTAAAVTDVSGRGVGMDAVKTVITSLGGTLLIASEKGAGTRIIMKLPHTIAIIQVLLVACGGMILAIPGRKILRMLELTRHDIHAGAKGPCFSLDGDEAPLLNLAGLLGLLHPRYPERIPTVVVEIEGLRTGLAVENFIGQQEIFVKPLGRPLSSLKGIAGGTILGNGQIIFLLEVTSLL